MATNPAPARPAPLVCLVQQSASFDGSALSGLLLVDGLKAGGYRTAVIFGREGPMIGRYRAAGHAVSVVPHFNWLRSTSLLRFARHLQREFAAAGPLRAALEQLRPDLVYLNSVVSLAGAIAARRLRLPVIWHLRELFEDVGGEMQAPRPVRGLVPRFLRHYAQQHVVISAAVENNLLGRHGGQARRIPNAGGPDYDAPPAAADPSQRARLGLPPSGLVIGVPGTLRPIKGHPFLLRALPSVLRRFPDVQVVITGEGEDAYRDELAALARAQGIDHRIRFLGPLPDMPAFYRLCDLVCIPSRAEGFGRTVIEAFAAGVPVVATRVSGIAEIVRHGDNGLLVPYGDTPALEEAVVSLLGSSSLRARLAGKARTDYLAEYRTDLHGQRIRAVVAEVLADRTAPLLPTVEQ